MPPDFCEREEKCPKGLSSGRCLGATQTHRSSLVSVFAVFRALNRILIAFGDGQVVADLCPRGPVEMRLGLANMRACIPLACVRALRFV